LKTIH